MNEKPTAAAAGKIDVGGDLTVNRLGFVAMRITGPGIWGDPLDRDRARGARSRGTQVPWPGGWEGTAAVLAAVAQVHATLAVAEAIEAAFASRRRPEIPPPGIVPSVVPEPWLPGVGPLPGL